MPTMLGELTPIAQIAVVWPTFEARVLNVRHAEV
jgi:hypothetical protein